MRAGIVSAALGPLRPTSRKLVAAGCALTLMVAGACGSSSKSSSSATTVASGQGGSGQAGGSSGAPIKVGLMCTCSGAFGANTSTAADVWKAWVSATNASGGIDGHQIQVTTEDDAGVPGTALSDVQKLISSGVDAIVDNSLVDDTWATEVQASHIPVVGMDLSNDTFYKFSDFYPEGQTADSATYAVASTAKLAGASTVGTLYCAESASCAQQGGQFKAAAQKLGVTQIVSAEISGTAPNYTAQCVAAQQGKAQALFILDGADQIVNVGADCNKQGYHPTYLQEGLGFQMILTTSPGVKDNMWSEMNDYPFYATTANVQAMNTAVDKYYPGIRQKTNLFSELCAMGWVSGLLLQDAVKASGIGTSGTPSAAAITKGLNSLKGDTLDGWSPPLTFTAGQPHPVDCWFTSQIKNGMPSLANNGKVSCENGSSSS